MSKSGWVETYGRNAQSVSAHNPQQQEEHFLNGEQVQAGMAYLYAKYASRCPNVSAIAQAESLAKQQHRGIWNDAKAVKPWDGRRQK